MSDNVMSSERANELLNNSWDSTDIKHDYDAALRTVIAQAEQIETLSRLLSGAEEAAIERAEQIEQLQDSMQEVDDFCGRCGNAL